MNTLTHSSSSSAAGHSVPLINVTADIACLQVYIVNVLLVGEPGMVGGAAAPWVLVDAGMPGSAGRILRAVEERFGPGARPEAIVLTHGHFDHVGALRTLADRWDVPIYAHEMELPYLTGKSAYPPPDPTVGGGLMARSAFLYPRGPYDFSDRIRVLPADGSVPGMPGWRWVHTPGHTAGHVALFRESDRALIAGDAFVTTKQESAIAVMTQREEMHGPPMYYTSDWPAARESVRRLDALHPAIAVTGHGLPMENPRLAHDLHALARDFDAVAVPRHGRYVARPAITDRTGVVAVPPPPPTLDVGPTVLIGLAALGVAAGMVAYLRGRGREEERQRAWQREREEHQWREWERQDRAEAAAAGQLEDV